MLSITLAPRVAGEAEFDDAEALYEGLDHAEDARDALGVEDRLVLVSVDGTPLLVRFEDESWSIWRPAAVDESDAALAARKLHGLLGQLGEGWDLDR